MATRVKKSHSNDARLYRIYHHIKDRVGNPRNDAYANYGGRGIRLSKEWLTFEAFRAWALSHGYKDGLTLERIDNDKGYSPSNCRWATDEEQSNNRRSNEFVTYKGKKQTYRQWEKELGLSRGLIAVRKFRGHSPVETIKKYDSELAHHGIKGQKWGIRRYQNPDGSLTPEGRYRYRKGWARYGNRAVVNNGRKWGSLPTNNVLYIAGESNTGKTTFADALIHGKAKGFEGYYRQSNLIHLDGYTESNNVDLRNPDFDRFLKENGFSPDTLYKKDRSRADFDRFTDLLEVYGKESYRNNYGVVAEGRQLLDDTFYPNKKKLKTKPVILITEKPFNPIRRSTTDMEQRMLDSWN